MIPVPRVSNRIPGAIVAFLLGTAAVIFSSCRWKPSARASAEFPRLASFCNPRVSR
jgi:hypothetical protein